MNNTTTLLTGRPAERDERPPPAAPPRRWMHVLGLGGAAHLIAQGHRCYGTHPNRGGRTLLYLVTRSPEAMADLKAYSSVPTVR
jgi:hypothetical protein